MDAGGGAVPQGGRGPGSPKTASGRGGLTVRARIVCAAAVWVCTALTVGAAEPPYRVAPGDTLWDLSGRQWNDPSLWPELWAMNPHIRNPHWIFPGEEIRFDRSAGRPARPEPRIVRLPVERLTPSQGAGATAEVAEAPA
ncbi:MAG: LysM peptidoglycan-binding domain-containing protein, partial [Deltaproteobacteria bacterium]|nr:LysM peptidoglycan-binding domain-containing protein [Deltaproteobacteria bacterium]